MSTRRVILVHGFNVADDGEKTVGQLQPFFEDEGCKVKRFPYGWRGLLGVRFGNPGLAKILAAMADEGDIAVGHSNGCAIIHEASRLGAQFAGIVYINPALDDDSALPAHIPVLHVWHSPSDSPVKWARWLPWHSWGDMGADGYKGTPDPRITCFDKENGFPVSSREHSDVFREPCLSYFGPLIAGRILEAVAEPVSP